MLVRETAAQRPVVVCSQDKLKKDQRNAEVNLLKINDQWRTILRQTKGAELRGDLMVLSQTFEGHVDVLDSIIQVRRSKTSAMSPGSHHRVTSCLQTLVRELRDAERQSAQARRAHLQNMEELRTQQEKQLKVLQQLWDTDMQELVSGFSHDRSVRLHSAPRWANNPVTPDTPFAPVNNRGIVGNVVRLIIPQK